MQQTPAEVEMTRHSVFAAFDGDERARQFLQTPQHSDEAVAGIVYINGAIRYNPMFVMSKCRTRKGRAEIYADILSLFGEPVHAS